MLHRPQVLPEGIAATARVRPSPGQLLATIDQIRSMADVLDICRTGIG
jgi:hypothetical protein